jgi:hypothetical protein
VKEGKEREGRKGKERKGRDRKERKERKGKGGKCSRGEERRAKIKLREGEKGEQGCVRG